MVPTADERPCGYTSQPMSVTSPRGWKPMSGQSGKAAVSLPTDSVLPPGAPTRMTV